MRVWLSPLFVIVFLGCGTVHAETDLDVTMRMVPEGEPVSDSVVRRIELPDGATGRVGAAARQGLDRAAGAPPAAREGVDRARERGHGLVQPSGVQGEANQLQGGRGQSGSDDRAE